LPKHLLILHSATPEEFAELRRARLEMGLAHVESGPLVRSSYRAAQAHAAKK
jgi:lipoic acid synthetase